MRTVLVLAVLAAGCGRQPDSSGRRVRLAAMTAGLYTAPLDIAGARGMFAAEGLSVELVDTSSGGKAMEALLGGSADVALASPSVVMQAALEGRHSRAFVSLMNCVCMSLVASPAGNPKLASVSAIANRSVSVTGFGSSSHFLLNWFIHRSGVQREEVKVVAGGQPLSQVFLLEQGRVDAGMVQGSMAPQLRRKFPALVVLAETETPEGVRRWFGVDRFAGYSLVATDEWLRDNAGAARRLARASTGAMRWMRAMAAADLMAVIPPGRLSGHREADLEAVGKMAAMLTPDGMFPTEAIEAARSMVAVTVGEARMAPLDIARTYTNELVKAAATKDNP